MARALTLRCGMQCGRSPALWESRLDGCARPGVSATIPGMDITLNGEPRTLPASTTLSDLLRAEGLLERRVAVEVNGHIVTRSLHGCHGLAEGDVVEIVHALGGG